MTEILRARPFVSPWGTSITGNLCSETISGSLGISQNCSADGRSSYTIHFPPSFLSWDSDLCQGQGFLSSPAPPSFLLHRYFLEFLLPKALTRPTCFWPFWHFLSQNPWSFFSFSNDVNVCHPFLNWVVCSLLLKLIYRGSVCSLVISFC